MTLCAEALNTITSWLSAVEVSSGRSGKGTEVGKLVGGGWLCGGRLVWREVG